MRPGMGSGCRSVFLLDDPRHRVYWGQIAALAVAVPNLLFAGNSPSAAATLSDHRRRCRSPTRLSPSYKGRTKGSGPLELNHMYLLCLPCANVTAVGCRRYCCSYDWWLLVCWCWSRRFEEPFSHQPSFCSRTWCTAFLRRKTMDILVTMKVQRALLLRLSVVQTSSTRFGTVGPSLQSPFIKYGILCQKVGLQWRSKTVLDDIFIGHRDLGVAPGMDLFDRNKMFRPKSNCPSDETVLDSPWAKLHISVALSSGWTLSLQCCCTPTWRPSLSPLGTLGAHPHCWGRADLFPGSLPLGQEITRVLTKPAAVFLEMNFTSLLLPRMWGVPLNSWTSRCRAPLGISRILR